MIFPSPSPNQKPNRDEALEYYRKVAEHYELDVRQYETVDRVTGRDGSFSVHTADRFGRPLTHRALEAGGGYLATMISRTISIYPEKI